MRSWTFPIREIRPEDFIADSIAKSVEPLQAARTVEPPFGLLSRPIILHVDVLVPILFRSIRRRPSLHFAAEAKFVNAAVTAMRTSDQKRHGTRSLTVTARQRAQGANALEE